MGAGGGLLAILLVFFFNPEALANLRGARGAIDITDQFVFPPNRLDTDSFSLETSYRWSWIPDSLEWVRVDRKFLLPKARLRLEVPAGTLVRYLDHVFKSDQDGVILPVVLTQEKGNEILVGAEKPVSIPVRFKRVRSLEPELVVDSSCSSMPIRFHEVKLDRSWVHVVCRSIHPKHGSFGSSQRYEVELRWETEGRDPSMSLNGDEIASDDGITHHLSFTQTSGRYRVSKGKDSFEVTLPVAERFHPFWLSMGIGPYSHGTTEFPDAQRAFPTFYAGYFLSETMKLVSFTAIPIKPKPEIDTGIYLVLEQFRGLDERIHLNLLLGAHAISFESRGVRDTRWSAPQGVELGFRDFILKGENLTLGSFFYPLIADRSYINTWLRFGSGKLFYEFNFIQWQEPISGGSFGAKSAGLSIGFPLLRAL